MKRLPADPFVADTWQQLLTHALGQKQVGFLGALGFLAFLSLSCLVGAQ